MNLANFTRYLGALPAWMPRMAFAPASQAPRGDVIVCVFQRGGMDGLNVVIPTFDLNYHDLRPTIAIPDPQSGNTKTAIDLDRRFSLHPALAKLKPLYDDGALAIVHACGSPDPSHSHFDAMDFMERGTPGARTLTTGWLARHLASLDNGNKSPLRAVGVNTMLQSSLRGEVPAIAMRSIADFHLRARPKDIASLQKTLAALYTTPATNNPGLVDAAQKVQDISQILNQINTGNYKPANGATYLKDDFAKGLQQVAQLIKAEVGLEVACVDIGGWDTHSNEGTTDGTLARLLTELGEGLAAFHSDLGDKARNVIVVTMSEFGRRARENGSGGTDHGHANVMFLLGGGVIGGKVYGEWPTLAPDKLSDPGDLAVTTDYRDILAEVVSKRLNNGKLDQVFPNYTPRMNGIVSQA